MISAGILKLIHIRFVVATLLSILVIYQFIFYVHNVWMLSMILPVLLIFWWGMPVFFQTLLTMFYAIVVFVGVWGYMVYQISEIQFLADFFTIDGSVEQFFLVMIIVFTCCGLYHLMMSLLRPPVDNIDDVF